MSSYKWNLDEYAKRMEKWPYIIRLDGLGESKGYNRKDFPGQNYADEQLKSILKRMGGTCKFAHGTAFIAIPMWRKGEKKTIAQLMLYHHLNSVNKAFKEEREKEEKQAKADFEYVLSRLKSGDFASKLAEDGIGYLITVKLEGSQRTGRDYWEKFEKSMEKRGFLVNKALYNPDTKYILYLPKKK